jgi:hypothetical protein
MIDTIIQASADDSRLSDLLDRTAEYAKLYTYAKAQRRGYIGIGDMNNLKEEFRSAFDTLVQYAEIKGILTCKIETDTDRAAADIMKLCGSDKYL